MVLDMLNYKDAIIEQEAEWCWPAFYLCCSIEAGGTEKKTTENFA